MKVFPLLILIIYLQFGAPFLVSKPSCRRHIGANVISKQGHEVIPSSASRMESGSSWLHRRRESIPLKATATVVDKEVSRTNSVGTLVDPEFARSNINDNIATVTQAMQKVGKGSSLIFDDDGNLAGIFTERDFVTKILDAQKQSATTLVSSVMTGKDKLITVSKSTSIKQCREIMIENSVRHLPVMSEDEKTAIGVISMTDIIRGLQKEELKLESANLYGQTLAQVVEQSKVRANELALESGAEGAKSDAIRASFVVAAATIAAALLQGTWVHDHEWLSMSLTFALGYIGIVFENYFEFNKAAIALLTATALWVIFAGSAGATGITIATAMADLSEKVSEVSEVVFFILGAMTIVEIVDAHQGFKVVTDVIKSKEKRNLMWVIGIITFFMSAILDNLTTTIVMVSLIKKILPDDEDRKLFGAMIVIAANAGGAWTPIGDVTTTMLWINGQITALPTMTDLFIPSLISVLLSIAVLQRSIPDKSLVPEKATGPTQLAPRGKLVFGTGIAGLLSVPVFKAATGLPPYLGMLGALGVMWTLTDAIHAGEGKDREELMAPAALRKIDTSGVLFFLGILLSVGALDSAGILRSLAELIDNNIPNNAIVATLIGFASSIIDNVPLVAATMGMYPLESIPPDDQLWQLIAFCAGTGGSLFVIGSAAGVALMGLESVDFVWYAKNITASALVGYLGGIGAYLLQNNVLPSIF